MKAYTIVTLMVWSVPGWSVAPSTCSYNRWRKSDLLLQFNQHFHALVTHLPDELMQLLSEGGVLEGSSHWVTGSVIPDVSSCSEGNSSWQIVQRTPSNVWHFDWLLTHTTPILQNLGCYFGKLGKGNMEDMEYKGASLKHQAVVQCNTRLYHNEAAVNTFNCLLHFVHKFILEVPQCIW